MTKVLLLHPEDECPRSRAGEAWGLIVDMGRAPQSTYEEWSSRAKCPVISLSQFSDGANDLRQVRQALTLGMGCVVDEWGIDWWDVLALMISPEIQRIPLLQRLAKELPEDCELYASRPDPQASALSVMHGTKLQTQHQKSRAVQRKVRHYAKVLTRLDGVQLRQVLFDKIDPEHSIRRRFKRRGMSAGSPLVLLPSAYGNVSRTAVAYAELLPEQSFFLVHARESGRLQSLPANVDSAPLDSYFAPSSQNEIAVLLDAWAKLRKLLVPTFPEFVAAEAMGALDRFPSLLRWGGAIRDAWNKVFESENITGCLCADDSNPYSRIPLILAKQRRLPAIACHHGALDYRMAIKSHYADAYLAKGEMEKDYLIHRCYFPAETIVLGAPSVASVRAQRPTAMTNLRRPYLTFFTEPYGAFGWRVEEVYRDLLPRLVALTEALGLQLVFKLHPFESIRGHRRLLRRYLPPGQSSHIEILAGPVSAELWEDTQCAMTVQSTMALECAERNVPVFLCAWFGDAHAGYIEQYARFGIGHILESPDQIARVPDLLRQASDVPRPATGFHKALEPAQLRGLLTAKRYLAAVVNS